MTTVAKYDQAQPPLVRIHCLLTFYLTTARHLLSPEYTTIFLLLTLLASKSVVGALTEHRCYDTVNGLYTLPEGTIMDRTQLESLSPVEYVDQLFARVATMQALELTEIEEHLLKSISVFNPGTRKITNSKDFMFI